MARLSISGSLISVVTLLTVSTACNSEEGVGPVADTDPDDSAGGFDTVDTGGGSSMSDGGSGRAGDGPCSDDSACPDDSPVCVEGACVQCTGEVTDACGGDAPVCDEDNACRACVAHDECDVACELDSGRCIDRLIVVDGAGEADYEDIGAALASIGPREAAAILVQPMEGCYIDSLTIAPERRVALLGPGTTMPCLTSLDDTPVLSLSGDARLYLDGIRIENALGSGIDGTGSGIWISRSEVVNNQGGGVMVSQTSRVEIRNSVIGGDRNNVPAVSVRDSDLDIAYSTLAGGFGAAVALQCSGEAFVVVRNSILVSEAGGGEVDCSNAVIKRSALESAFGVGNVAVGEVDTGAWFAGFARGDLHLDPDQATMFAEVAQWEVGDPSTDIDGDPRPTTHGDADWAGADVPGI